MGNSTPIPSAPTPCKTSRHFPKHLPDYLSGVRGFGTSSVASQADCNSIIEMAPCSLQQGQLVGIAGPCLPLQDIALQGASHLLDLRRASVSTAPPQSGRPKKNQKNPRVRKILVCNSGAGNGCANFMDTWKNAFFLQEKQCP